MQDKWFVISGIFEDGTWNRMIPGTGQCFGPFFDEPAAKQEMVAQIRRNIDICYHTAWTVKLDS